MRLEVDFTDEVKEEDYVLIVEYIPERPGPFCMNPDHPSYYDCGEPEEIEIIGEVDNRELDDRFTDDYLIELLIDDIHRAFETATEPCW